MYMVYDLETTIEQKFKRKANPFIKENWVVAEGWKYEGDEQASWTYMDEEMSRSSYMEIKPEADLLVGFNIKFDLLWELVRENKDLERFLKDGGKIWCCQYAEYLLRAQHPDWQMCSLNDTAIAYGGTVKIDAIKAMWEEGINTPDIPQDLLIDYLVGTEEEDRNGGDIGNTELVYLAQRELADKLGMTKMIEDRMDGLLATTFMEFHGLYVDTAFAKEYLIERRADLAKAEKELNSFIPELPKGCEFNWNSNIHKSCLIFGGAIGYKRQLPYKDENGEWARYKKVEKWPLFDGEPRSRTEEGMMFDTDTNLFYCLLGAADQHQVQDTYKSGKRMSEGKFKNVTVPGLPKVRYTDLHFELPGFTEPKKQWKGALTDALGKPTYGTGADIIDELTQRKDVPFLRVLGERTALDKEIGTYLVAKDRKTGKLKGMLTCVDPETKLIHHKLNHTSTVTTRLSSSDPNMQNIPRGDKSRVKQMFRSRFPQGKMVEADYSQLEVVVQGVLTKDKQLCEDLNNRIDFHCKRVSAKMRVTYDQALEWCKDEASSRYAEWKVHRTNAKVFSFQRAYGAGAATIAYATGMSIDEVEALVAAEIALYPEVEEYYADVTAQINNSAEPFRAQRENGSWGYFRRGYYSAPTGTRYTWRSYDAPDFLKKQGIMDTFSPPEIRNYPVQGTGGEFVQCVIGLLIRHLIRNNFFGGGMFSPAAILCNTVHDCVWYDCLNSAMANRIWTEVQPIMQSIPEYYNDRYGMDINVPFPVDGEVGENMNNLSHFH